MWPTPHPCAEVLALPPPPFSVTPWRSAWSADQTQSSSNSYALQLHCDYRAQLTPPVFWSISLHWDPQFTYFTASSYARRETSPEVCIDSLLSHTWSHKRGEWCYRKNRWSQPTRQTQQLLLKAGQVYTATHAQLMHRVFWKERS